MMTDAEVADQIERADRFIADFREMIAATVVDPASLCADYQRRGLQRIADTLDAVPFVTMCNLANINAATLRKGTDGLAIVALVRRLDLDAVIITLAGQGRPAAIPILAKLPFDRNGCALMPHRRSRERTPNGGLPTHGRKLPTEMRRRSVPYAKNGWFVGVTW